jgi:hypothetical protein
MPKINHIYAYRFVEDSFDKTGGDWWRIVSDFSAPSWDILSGERPFPSRGLEIRVSLETFEQIEVQLAMQSTAPFAKRTLRTPDRPLLICEDVVGE